MSEFTVEDAHRLASTAHRGQTDKQGRPYYEGHLLPIAEEVASLGPQAVMAALLHDVIEDTHMTEAHLLTLGVPDDVVRAVASVTKRDGESYEALISRSCADPLGVHIKLADNAHNIRSNPALAVNDLAKAESLLNDKYLPARDRLIAARTRHELGLPIAEAQAAEPVEDGMQSIGEVVSELAIEFPGLSVPKIRFLESEGLIAPIRLEDGRRRFDLNQVARLRFILTKQRDGHLPLARIAELLGSSCDSV